MHSLFRNQRRCFETSAYLNIFNRMVVRLRHERCQSKHKFFDQTMTDEEFGKIIADPKNRLFHCCYWICEGIIRYFDR